MMTLSFSPADLWRQYPRETFAFGGLALAATIAAAGSAWSTPGLGEIERARTEQTAPAPPPLLIREIAPEQALSVNAKTPLASGPNPAALPFDSSKLSTAARARALDCLASAEYYEAGTQGDDGERAVAQVVLNRVRHPAFPSTVCGVVYQGSTRTTGCQFTFTCDGSLRRQPDAAGWKRARRIAEAALSGAVYSPIGWSTHYHANYVVPYWASSMAKDAIVGAHIFYRWAGNWGRPDAFSQGYSRSEPDSAALRSAALAALASRPTSAVREIADIPGVEVEKAPAGRVAVRFNVAAARKAVEAAPHKDYVEQFAASDNLKWSLGGGADIKQAPLGSTQQPSSAAASDN
jgi:spore germination cell wall hydrolase CwlJ-like protein